MVTSYCISWRVEFSLSEKWRLDPIPGYLAQKSGGCYFIIIHLLCRKHIWHAKKVTLRPLRSRKSFYPTAFHTQYDPYLLNWSSSAQKPHVKDAPHRRLRPWHAVLRGYNSCKQVWISVWPCHYFIQGNASRSCFLNSDIGTSDPQIVLLDSTRLNSSLHHGV